MFPTYRLLTEVVDNPRYSVRALQDSDINSICNLISDNYRKRYDKLQFNNESRQRNYNGLVCVDGENLAGVLIYGKPSIPSANIQIYYVAVPRQYRNEGIAKELMVSLLEQNADKCIIFYSKEVPDLGQLHHRVFYRDIGFQIVRKEKDGSILWATRNCRL